MLRRAPILLIFLGLAAHAQILPPLDIHERYEEQLIADTLAAEGLQPDPAPLGKTVERIVVAPHDVFVRNFDPIPTFFNIFHVTTKPYVLRRELLFKEGDVIGPDTLEESERNLRSFFVLSVARLVTARGSTPDKVVVVVVAKDLWTLRPNMNFTYENGNLDLFSLTLAEHNLLGRNKFFGLNFRMDPATYWFGAHYTDPRVVGTRIYGDAQGLVIVNRGTGDAEGTISYLKLGRPLFSLATEWGWDAGATYVKSIERRFQDGKTDPLFTYDQNAFTGLLDGVRSFGRRWKSNFTFGYELDVRHFAPEPGALAMNVPTSEDDSMLFLRYDFFEAQYRTFQNINAFALTEDFRFGPEAAVSVSWAPEELGTDVAESASDLTLHGVSFARLFAHAGVRLMPLRDDIFWVGASIEARYEPSLPPSITPPCNHSTSWLNQIETLGLTNVSPRFWMMRLHVRAYLELHDCDLNNTVLLLGGTQGLRGYPAGQFIGHNEFIGNVELRTSPISLWTLYVGAVAFWDGGEAWLQYNGQRSEYNGSYPIPIPAGFHQDAGVGIRAQLPQFNHYVVRLDLAFPFDQGATSPVITAGFDQAF